MSSVGELEVLPAFQCKIQCSYSPFLSGFQNVSVSAMKAEVAVTSLWWLLEKLYPYKYTILLSLRIPVLW